MCVASHNNNRDDEGGEEEEEEEAGEGEEEGEEEEREEEEEEVVGVVEGEQDQDDGREVILDPGVFDLTQVLDAGVPMRESQDATLANRIVLRLPRLARRPGLRSGSRRAPQQLVTGDVITLTTPNPVEYPLPHPDLLTLHSAIIRVARAAGAMVEEEDNWDWSDEEEERQRTISGCPEDLDFTLRRFLREAMGADGKADGKTPEI